MKGSWFTKPLRSTQLLNSQNNYEVVARARNLARKQIDKIQREQMLSEV